MRYLDLIFIVRRCQAIGTEGIQVELEAGTYPLYVKVRPIRRELQILWHLNYSRSAFACDRETSRSQLPLSLSSIFRLTALSTRLFVLEMFFILWFCKR